MDELSRREFLRQSALGAGTLSLWLSLAPRALRAAQASREPAFLEATEWAALDAIAQRLIPSDDTPGAREADCVNFIDKLLAEQDSRERLVVRSGLLALGAVCARRHDKAFAELEPGEQDTLLRALEAGSLGDWPISSVAPQELFETVRLQTLLGFLSDPRYGGNNDYVGWKLMGYPGPRHLRGGYSPEQMLGKKKIRSVWGEDL